MLYTLWGNDIAREGTKGGWLGQPIRENGTRIEKNGETSKVSWRYTALFRAP
jgi:hypothetical protein